MAFVPAPQIVEIEWRALNAGQQIENRVMVNVGTTPTAEICAALAELAYDWFVEWYAPSLSDEVALQQVVATSMATAEGPQVSYGPAPVAGEVTGNAFPNEVSFCVSLRSASRGRSARGRFFWMAIVVNQTDSANTASPTVVASFLAAIEALRAAIDTAGYLLVIVSYESGGGPRPGGPVYFPVVTAIATTRVLASMRSRRPGVGT